MKRYITAIAVLFALMALTGCAVLGGSKTGEGYMEKVEAKGNYGSWKKMYYLNDFKKSTGVPYIETVCSGTYSSKDAKDAPLKATVMCDRDDVKVELLEEESTPLSFHNSMKASVTAKILSGNKEINLGECEYDSTTGYITIASTRDIFEALVNNRSIMMHVTIEERNEISTYLFKISGYGFEYCYQQAFK